MSRDLLYFGAAMQRYLKAGEPALQGMSQSVNLKYGLVTLDAKITSDNIDIQVMRQQDRMVDTKRGTKVNVLIRRRQGAR